MLSLTHLRLKAGLTYPTFHPTLQKSVLDEMLDTFARTRKLMLDEKMCWMMLDESLFRNKLFIQHHPTYLRVFVCWKRLC